MQSKITIEIDHDNQPIIKIKYVNTDDVRDKLVKRFLESFGGASCWATFYFNDHPENPNTEAFLRPIHPTDLPMKVIEMKVEADKQAKMQADLEAQFPNQ